MPAPKTLLTVMTAGMLVVPTAQPKPAQADVKIVYGAHYGKNPYYKRGFGYGHYPPYVVKRPRYYGYRSPRHFGRYGYGHYYSYGYVAPWVFKKPYYGTPRYAHGPAIERKLRPAPTNRTIWSTAPSGRRVASAKVYCAPFEDRVRIDGQWQRITGRVCQQPDGSWKLVSR